ncbi:hypothetical protein PPTG_05451 [Phytophthora nicotianae INRA-310]|uniref:Uncharacterized protein n=1 Tax=Phytophthora nicotianae (strain INRA-310) TaxID=761204 RepID=W2QWX1_PHYN3|nr:hypothetical protein PPTG_05451 [Phytophthora nicotianae INRA-310]ETN17717.1 hypothetical protein PPTG_05451 [Phytophthora nicotianae INRA-310]
MGAQSTMLPIQIGHQTIGGTHILASLDASYNCAGNTLTRSFTSSERTLQRYSYTFRCTLDTPLHSGAVSLDHTSGSCQVPPSSGGQPRPDASQYSGKPRGIIIDTDIHMC